MSNSIDSLPDYTPTGREAYISASNTDEIITIDAEIYDLVSPLKWHISDTGYAMRRDVINGQKKTVRLHKLVAVAPEGMVVDHINRNKLDNRKSNLRIVTQKVNLSNSIKVDNAKYYYYEKRRNRWVVDSRKHGVRWRQFKDEESAKQFVERMKAKA